MVSYICLQMLIWTSIFDKLFANVKDAPFRFKLPIQTFASFYGLLSFIRQSWLLKIEKKSTLSPRLGPMHVVSCNNLTPKETTM